MMNGLSPVKIHMNQDIADTENQVHGGTTRQDKAEIVNKILQRIRVSNAERDSCDTEEASDVEVDVKKKNSKPCFLKTLCFCFLLVLTVVFLINRGTRQSISTDVTLIPTRNPTEIGLFITKSPTRNPTPEAFTRYQLYHQNDHLQRLQQPRKYPSYLVI